MIWCRFSDIVCGFLFLLNNFPLQSLEYATYSSVLIRTAEELSYRAVFPIKPVGKLKSLQGTELSVVVVIRLLGSFWILTLDLRCWLIVNIGTLYVHELFWMLQWSAIYCLNPKLRLCFVRNFVLLYINDNEKRCA